jgi:hypothetical protein
MRTKRYLFGHWIGITNVYWALVLTWGIYLTRYPLWDWSLYQIALALCVLVWSLIIGFWTAYLLGYYVRGVAKCISRIRLSLFRAFHVLGQTATLLIVLISLIGLFPNLLPGGAFFQMWEDPIFWVVLVMGILTGFHHFFYKVVSSGPTRFDALDRLFVRVGQGDPVPWGEPRGGSIGVEVRRLRRLQSRLHNRSKSGIPGQVDSCH